MQQGEQMRLQQEEQMRMQQQEMMQQQEKKATKTQGEFDGIHIYQYNKIYYSP